MHINKILILKLIPNILSLFTIVAYLILKIILYGFIAQDNPLQYTLCSDYIKLKYSNQHMVDIVQNTQLIIIILLDVILLVKCLHTLVKEKPQQIEEVAETKWIKAQFIITSIIITFLVCIVATLSSKLKAQQQCDSINTQNFIIFLALILFTLILKLLIAIINFYIISKNHKQLQQAYSQSNPNNSDPSQISQLLKKNQIFQNLQKMQNQHLFDMNPKQIRQKLLNQHALPDDEDPMNSFLFGNRFQQFQKNYQTKIQRKIQKKIQQLKSKLNKSNANNGQNNHIQRVINEQIILGPQDKLDPEYDREKVKQVEIQTIKRLQQKGYTVQQRPYIQKTILTKKFKTSKNHQQNSKACNKDNIFQGQNQTEMKQIDQENQQTIEIVINIDTREQKTPDQCLTGQDMQSIQLDNIYYREYLQKQKKQKEQLRLKILKIQKQKQLQKQLINSQRLQCSYHKYIAQDRFNDQQYLQSLQYASKRKQTQYFQQQQLACHIKTKSKTMLQNKALHNQISKYFKDQIRNQNGQIIVENQNKTFTRRRKSTVTDPNLLEKFKDRKNPLQIIRGKGVFQ